MSEDVRIPPERGATAGGLPAGLDMDREAHDAWFRTRVREALDDPGAPVPHGQAMEEVRALIDAKRRARS